MGISLAEPNYAKTVMPEFYAMLRKAIKGDEALRRIIQLNSLILGAGGAAGLSSAGGQGAFGSMDQPVEKGGNIY